MDCGDVGQEYIEGSTVGFLCSVELTGPLDPVLTWYQGDREIRGGFYMQNKR